MTDDYPLPDSVIHALLEHTGDYDDRDDDCQPGFYWRQAADRALVVITAWESACRAARIEADLQ